MLAEDVTPNRLEHGKQVLLDLLQDLQGVEVAVVAFAGEAVLVCPFTLDHEFAQSALQELNPDTVAEGGSDLGVALSFLAAQPLPAGTADLVVLVSDGGHQEVVLPTSWQLPPGRILYVLGVGEPNQDAVIPLSSSGVLHDQRGRPVVTRLAEEHLQTIARAGDGVYVHAETGAFDPSAVFASIRTEESSVAAPARWVGADWLLLAAFTLAMLQRIPAGFTSRGR